MRVLVTGAKGDFDIPFVSTLFEDSDDVVGDEGLSGEAEIQ